LENPGTTARSSAESTTDERDCSVPMVPKPRHSTG
jgi:hypothetical protein